MKRRVFITLLGVATVRPFAAYAQQSTMPIVGFMNLSTARPFMEAALRQGLSNTGYSEGQNVTTEYIGPRATTTDFRHWRPIWCAAA